MFLSTSENQREDLTVSRPDLYFNLTMDVLRRRMLDHSVTCDRDTPKQLLAKFLSIYMYK